jgi:excisionase family DNA binding protein
MAEQLIDVRELAEALSVPTSWVYSRTRQKGPDTIPHLRLGKYRRFRLREVLAYLEKQQNEQE